MAQSKSKRLVDLLTLLLASRYPVSRASIQRVAGYPKGAEAFHRQFERDKQELRGLGFPVREAGSAEDDEGGYVLDRHGASTRGVHAMQVEVCRSTYLDSHLREPGPGLAAVVRVLSGLVRRMAEELAGGRSLPQAAE